MLGAIIMQDEAAIYSDAVIRGRAFLLSSGPLFFLPARAGEKNNERVTRDEMGK